MTETDCSNLPVVIVSCGQRKLNAPAKAGDLYSGDYFFDAIRYARSITCEGNIFIVSARYGLVKTNQVLRPYNLKLGDPGSITADTLAQQAQAHGIAGAPVIVLAGKKYRALIEQVFTDVCAPFAGPKLAFQRQGMRKKKGVNLCAQQ